MARGGITYFGMFGVDFFTQRQRNNNILQPQFLQKDFPNLGRYYYFINEIAVNIKQTSHASCEHNNYYLPIYRTQKMCLLPIQKNILTSTKCTVQPTISSIDGCA